MKRAELFLGAYVQIKKYLRLTRNQFRRRWRKFRNWISKPCE